MKSLALTLICIFALSSLFAQKIELSVQANSGLFHYSGKSAASQSAIIGAYPASSNYTNNPYGNSNGFSYGGSLQAQFVSKGGFIAGLQAGYDILRSKVNINSVAPFQPFYNLYLPLASYIAVPPIAAKGQTVLKNASINISPYVGYRIKASKINIDLMPGLDVGFNLNSREKGQATTTNGDNTTMQTDLKRAKAPTDVRLKFGAAAICKKLSITASYAHGLTNYESKIIGGDFEVHSELIRVGVGYRLL